ALSCAAWLIRAAAPSGPSCVAGGARPAGTAKGCACGRAARHAGVRTPALVKASCDRAPRAGHAGNRQETAKGASGLAEGSRLCVLERRERRSACGTLGLG